MSNRLPPSVVVALLLAALLAACGDDDSPGQPDAGVDAGLDVGQAECNPLGGVRCALPLPSSIYQRADTASATGVRLDFPSGALPTNGDGVTVDPATVNGRDGFSPSAQIFTVFPGGVDPANLPPITDPGQSLAAASPTVLLDMASGERVLHFAEVDAEAGVLPDEQALIIRPLAQLAGNRRYAVAVRKSLHGRSGGALPIPAGFQAILDGRTTSHTRLEERRGRHAEIFTALAAAGVPREDLVVAWDFTTASEASLTGDLVGGRDAALAAAGTAGANLTLTVASNELPAGWDPLVTERFVQGTFKVPLLLTANGGDLGVLARDGTGRPMVTGMTDAPFWAVVPACAAARKPVPIVIYGHGMLGSGDEIGAGHARKTAQHLCAVMISTNWRGMSEVDVPSVALVLNDVSKIALITDKLVQGIVNTIMLEQIARGPLAAHAAFQDAGMPLLDTTKVHYYGNSQGGIFGGTFMAHDPFVTRGVLGVPGANYAVMLERSSDWGEYYAIMQGAYPNLTDRLILIMLLEMGWDKTDPAIVAPGMLGVNGTPIPGTPPKQILMHVAVGDSQVPILSAEIEARSMGIPLLAPAAHTPWGMTAMPGPLSSAITFLDEHPTPFPPITNTALPDNGTHGSIRKLRATNEQMKIFFETGQIVQTCVDGAGMPAACDCAVPTVCGPPL